MICLVRKKNEHFTVNAVTWFLYKQTTNALRETMIDTNFQIRSLNRLDENLEKIKIEIDKNIKKNNMSCFIRSGRPTREMVNDSIK